MRTPRIRRPRLSYANVAATLALVLAASMGGAYAHHGLIGPAEIKKNAVKSRHIGFQQVRTPDLGKRSVATSKIRPRAVGKGKLAPGAKAMWAVVSADGEIASQSGGISVAQHNSNGFTALRFPRPVRRRAVVATVLTGGVLGTPLGEPGIKATPCGFSVGDCVGRGNRQVVVAPFISDSQDEAAFSITVLP